MSRVAVLLLALPLFGNAVAELPSYERQVYGIEVLDAAAEPIAHPWLGGLNIPRPQLVDIDGDGDLDLFAQEFTDQVKFFENVGSATAWEFVWRSDAYADLAVGEWYLFHDLDADGDYDLLGEEPFSRIRVWRNDGDARQASWTPVGAMLDPQGDKVFSDRQNIPKLGDLDCDGRLDLLIGRVEGIITRYEAEGFTEAGEPVFGFVEDRFQGIEIIGAMAMPGAPRRQQGQQPTLHGANTMALHDIDADGDLDLFWGDFFEAGVLEIENTGTCRSPSMRGEPRPFPPNDPLRTSGYNAPAFGDIDGDGASDLLVGVLGGAYNPQTTTIDNFWLLSQESPGRFRRVTSRLLPQLDVGSESIPALGDLDGDGDLDLLLANKIQPDDNQTGAVFHFENVGTPAAPRFQARGAMPELTGHFHFAPALGDLDADGDLDMLLGTWDDELQLVRNTGTPQRPQWVIEDPAYLKLSRGRNATPALGDLDGDGDLDVLVGESSGELNYWRNDGTPQQAAYVLVSDKYLGIDGGRRSRPALHDIDGDGDLDLLLGSESEGVVLYRNDGGGAEPQLVRDESLTVVAPPFAAPVFGDLDADGAAELLVGNVGGGALLYRVAR